MNFWYCSKDSAQILPYCSKDWVSGSLFWFTSVISHLYRIYQCLASLYLYAVLDMFCQGCLLTCRHLERMPVTLSPFASLRVNSAKGSGEPAAELLRCAQDGSQDISQ